MLVNTMFDLFSDGISDVLWKAALYLTDDWMVTVGSKVCDKFI